MQSAVAAPGVRNDTHAISRWKARLSTRQQPASSRPNDGNDLLSSLCFLHRMASAFEEQGNYAECVKSMESLLLLRQANAAAVTNILEDRRRYLAEQAHRRHISKVRRGSPGTGKAADDDYVPLTDDGSVALPVNISVQAQDVVLRCNSYAVEALHHAQYDGTAFFLNRAMFLTDGNEDAQQGNSPTDGPAGIAKSNNDVVSGQWWWRTVLQSSAPQGESTLVATTADSADLDELQNTHDRMKQATEATAAAFRACFGPTPQDQQLRLSLRAVTLNHLGCLEQRRGRLRAAVVFLRMAIQTQARLDESRRAHGDAIAPTLVETPLSDAGSNSSGTTHTASTYLNLCTVLNELGQHAEAVQVCERVIPLLQQGLMVCCRGLSAGTLEKVNGPDTQRRQREAQDAQNSMATMLAVAYYNLGASLERRNAGGGSTEAQRWAFQEAIQVCHRYRLVPRSCRTAEQVMQALRHPGKTTALGDEEEEEVSNVSVRKEGTDMRGSASRQAEKGSCGAPSSSGSSAVEAMTSAAGRHCANVAAARCISQPMNPSACSTLSAAAAPTANAIQPSAPPAAHEAQPWPRRLSPLSTSSPGPLAASSPPSALSPFDVQENGWTAPFMATAPQAPPAVLEPLDVGDRQGSGVNLAATAPPALTTLQRRSLPFPVTGSSVSSGLDTAHQSASELKRHQTFGSSNLSALMKNSATNNRCNSSGTQPGSLPRNSLAASLGSLATGSAKTTRGPSVSNRLQAALDDRERSMPNSAKKKLKRRKNDTRRQQREMAEVDAALAERVFNQLISEKEKSEVARRRRAAVQIQRIWRGVLARTWVSTLIVAATKIQDVVRRFLVRVRVQRALEAKERVRRQAEELARQEAACRILQARTRQFLRRLQIRREYRARKARHYYAARTIQRGYRAFCERRAAFLAARAEVYRREDEQRRFRQKVAARAIQRAYLEYRTKRAELDEHHARQQRIRAAVQIQAIIRGYLTRAWYAYYRVYRRNQEVRSAAMQSKLAVIQSACRAICSAYYGQKRALQSLFALQEKRQHHAATQLQCLWRCHVAKIRRARLQAEHDCLVRQTTRIQRWYRMAVLRRAFLIHRVEQRRIRAASRLQSWMRQCWQAAKAKEFAAYHAALLRQQQLNRLQARAIVVMQACCTAYLSDQLVSSVRQTYQRRDIVARVWQRVGRGFGARCEMALTRRAAYLVAVKEREEARRTRAVYVLQRAWRCAAAKDKVERMRREVAAADVITRAYRVYRAQVQLVELRDARQLRLENSAARRIQRVVRGFLYHQRAREMDAYYRGEHLKKMRRLRQEEAAIMIQSLWRGHATRMALEQEKAVWQDLGAAAARIQRAWRSQRSRQLLDSELNRRIKERARDTEAALVVQCRWRQIMAVRQAAHMRVMAHQRLIAGKQIHMWWRVQLAKRELERQRIIRKEEEALQLYYAMQWEKHVTLLNSFIRTRQAQVLARERLHDRLVGQLTEAARRRFLRRHRAATKIQSIYRGHYERVYVRGLVAQIREETRKAAEMAARQQRAAITIQCSYRCARARQQLADLKQAELERVLVSHQEMAEKADSADVVRELFWLNEAYQQREAGQARLRRVKQKRTAAATIQRAYRCYKSRQQIAKFAEQQRCEWAARLLQDFWRHYLNVHNAKKREQREAAATRLQCHIRGWLVRRSWPLWRAAVEAKRRERVVVLDMQDRATIVLQCFWRRVLAQRTARRLRQAHQMRQQARAKQEAATIIQTTFREHQRRRQAKTW
ncbi:hypothetical protein JKF63_05098 [Porcisia hertigi]|uniref:Uncharacterized protein n=1 Tax=Porcisia hertigi TaxID=2761500 RepID=A0A836LCW0_9TRYP|nr:hypothetical protein JKF63_05098 [Porcisia hertigi]